MKITCTLDNFKKAISNSERMVSKQNTLPILNNILISAEKGGLRFSATNLEVGVVVRIGAKVEKEGGLTIPARLISNVINNLSSKDNIELEVSNQVLKIKSGSVKANIKGLPANDFPLIPQKSADFQLQIRNSELKNILSKILASVALNETRQELTGVNLILTEKEIFFASTDSFRLSEYKLLLNDQVIDQDGYQNLIDKKNNIIIPANTLIELNRIISGDENGNVKMAIEENQIFFETNGTNLVSRLINGKYPEYKHIMPKDFKTRVVGEKELIAKAIKMASVFASGKTNEITLKIVPDENKLIIEAKSVEVGENTSELNLDCVGPSQEIVFNSKYLLDGINMVSSDKVALLFNSEATPAALREINNQTGEVLDDYIYIAMPIKN